MESNLKVRHPPPTNERHACGVGSGLSGLPKEDILGASCTISTNWPAWECGGSVPAGSARLQDVKASESEEMLLTRPMLRFLITLLSSLKILSLVYGFQTFFFLFGGGTLSPNEILRLPSLLKNAALMLTDDN